MSGGRDRKVAKLKAQIEQLERDNSSTPNASFNPRRQLYILAGIMFGAVVLAGAFYFSTDWTKQLAGVQKAQPSPAGALATIRSKVRHDADGEISRAGLDRALNERYPGGVRVLTYSAFYFDDRATYCGHLRPRGAGSVRRFVSRADFLVAEGDLSPSGFADFWTICIAAGYK